MTENDDLFNAAVSGEPKDIDRELAKIEGLQRQAALDDVLYRSVIFAQPKIRNIRHLLDLGADPNSCCKGSGNLLNHVYDSGLENILGLLLSAGANVNAENVTVLEDAVRGGDIKYVVRSVESGADLGDTERLLFSDSLIDETDDPKIQKFLIDAGVKGNADLDLDDVELVTIDDFEYPEMKDEPEQKVNLIVSNHNKLFCIVTGDTKEHQAILREFKGRYNPDGKCWLIPNKNKKLLQLRIAELEQETPTSDATDTPMSDTVETPTSDPTETPVSDIDDAISETPVEYNFDEIMESVQQIDRPVIEKDSEIILTGLFGKYPQFLTEFSCDGLFTLNDMEWDSVERYIMYKLYEGSYKGDAIKKAESLADARKLYEITSLKPAKSPKDLVINQKLKPYANSKINKSNLGDIRDLFKKATRAKFKQNPLIRRKLVGTGELEIITDNMRDRYGYEGNALGRLLMEIRKEDGGKDYDSSIRYNNLVMEPYSGNSEFYVVRGDPDPDFTTELRELGTHTIAGGKVIPGKLNQNLQGGSGWLIPMSAKSELEELVFDTYPNYKKIQVATDKWITRHAFDILRIALIYARHKDQREITDEDITFAVEKVLGNKVVNGENGAPDHFREIVTERLGKMKITDDAMGMLWRTVSGMADELIRDVIEYSQFEEINAALEDEILETAITPVHGLTPRESALITAFSKLYGLVSKAFPDAGIKNCITAVQMILGKDHYQFVKDVYEEKSKMKGKSEYPDEETQFRKRFEIKSPHTRYVLRYLPENIDKRCKLLVLTMLDYTTDLEGDEAIEISKRTILLGKESRVETPMVEPVTVLDTITPDIKTPVDGKVITPSLEKIETPSVTPSPAASAKSTKSATTVDDDGYSTDGSYSSADGYSSDPSIEEEKETFDEEDLALLEDLENQYKE